MALIKLDVPVFTENDNGEIIQLLSFDNIDGGWYVHKVHGSTGGYIRNINPEKLTFRVNSDYSDNLDVMVYIDMVKTTYTTTISLLNNICDTSFIDTVERVG